MASRCLAGAPHTGRLSALEIGGRSGMAATLLGREDEKGEAMRRLGQVVGTGLGTLGLCSSAWAQERTSDWGWHPMWGMWGAWGVGMMLVMLTVWVLVIVGLIALVRWLVMQGRESRTDTALEILRQRYARGEINKEEFDAKRRDLS
jgi:putative membrane protein